MDFLFLLVLLALIFVPSFLMMRRQRRQQGELQAMQASLKPGDLVVTSAGLHGAISSLTDTTVLLEVAPGVEVTFERIAILRSVPADQPAPIIGDGVEQNVAGDEVSEPEIKRGDDHPENFR